MADRSWRIYYDEWDYFVKQPEINYHYNSRWNFNHDMEHRRHYFLNVCGRRCISMQQCCWLPMRTQLLLYQSFMHSLQQHWPTLHLFSPNYPTRKSTQYFKYNEWRSLFDQRPKWNLHYVLRYELWELSEYHILLPDLPKPVLRAPGKLGMQAKPQVKNYSNFAELP